MEKNNAIEQKVNSREAFYDFLFRTAELMHNAKDRKQLSVELSTKHIIDNHHAVVIRTPDVVVELSMAIYKKFFNRIYPIKF